MLRVIYELSPPEAIEALVRVTSTGVPADPGGARPTVEADGERVTLTYPDANWGADLSLLVSSVVAGEWGDSGALERCRLVHIDWPDGLPGPAHAAPDRVLVGTIVKPALGLSPREAAAIAGELAAGGADLVKDDELIGDRPWSPLEERVRAIVAAIPERVIYVANVTGSADGLLHRAERAVELGAKGLLVNAWAQGFDAVRVLRDRDLGASVFAHRAGARPGCAGPSARAAARLRA